MARRAAAGAAGSASVVLVAAALTGGFLLGAASASFFARRRRRQKRKNDESSSSSRSLRGSQSSITRQNYYSHGFLTDLIDRLWPYMKIAVATLITEMIQESAVDLPKLLSTLRVTKCDLGNVPMRLDNIVVHETDTNDDSLQFDMDVVLDSDCDIQLKADYLGSFGVQDFVLQGRMSILFKPLTQHELPCFTALQYAFINPPELLRLNFTGLAQIADFTIIDRAIRTMIRDTLKGMVVLPNRIMYKMDPGQANVLTSYQPPIGILRLQLLSGRGFVVEKRRILADDIPDVYCNITLGMSAVWRTSTVWDRLSPVWPSNEMADFVVSDYEQQTTVRALDQDDAPLDADDDLGAAVFTVRQLLLSPGKTMEVELIHEKKMDTTSATVNQKQCVPTGAFVTLRGQILPFVTSNMASLEYAERAGANSLCGMITILVSRALHLPVSNPSEAASYVQVTYGDCADTAHDELFASFVTSTVVDYPGLDALNPQYDATFHIPLTSRMMMRMNKKAGKSVVGLTLVNGKAATVIGRINVTLADLNNAEDRTIHDTRAVGTLGARLEFRISLHAIQLPSSASDALSSSSTTAGGVVIPTPKALAANSLQQSTTSSSTTTSIGSRAVGEAPPLSLSTAPCGDGVIGRVKVTIVKGKGFEIQAKKHLFGKPDIPDVYCKVRFGSSPYEWTTSTIRDSVLPFWNESKVFPLRDHGEVIRIDVFDKDKNRTDDSLGQCRETVGRILLASRGIREMQLLQKGHGTEAFVTVRCELLSDET